MIKKNGARRLRLFILQMEDRRDTRQGFSTAKPPM